MNITNDNGMIEDKNKENIPWEKSWKKKSIYDFTNKKNKEIYSIGMIALKSQNLFYYTIELYYTISFRS